MNRFAAVLLLPLLAACSSLDQFDITLTQDGVLRGNLSSIPTNGGFPERWPAGATAAREIENQGVSASDITTAKVTAARVKVVSPAGGHLAYLTKFELFISAPGLPEKRLAHQDADFVNRKSTYDFLLDDVELKPYLAAPSMTMRPAIDQRSKPSQDHQLQLELVVHVDLSIVD